MVPDALLTMGERFLYLLLYMTLLFTGVTLLVALLREYLSNEVIARLLAVRKGRGNVIAALLGALTPFCTLTTLPVFMQLREAGVTFGALVSFLLASPLVNPVIVGLFAVLFGWQTTLVYVLICMAVAILSGPAWERMQMQQEMRSHAGFMPGACGPPGAAGTARWYRAGTGAWHQFRAVFPYLLLGAALAALIEGAVPRAWIVQVAGPGNPGAVPAAATVGMALYVGVESMLPVGLVLLDQGMGLGPVMALIVSAAGISLPEVAVLATFFKPRLLTLYVLTIFGLATGTGFLLSVLSF